MGVDSKQTVEVEPRTRDSELSIEEARLRRHKRKHSKITTAQSVIIPAHSIRPPSPLEVELRLKRSVDGSILEDPLGPGTRISERWIIEKHLGSFGHVHSAFDNKLNMRVAIKAYVAEKTTLEKEAYLLRKLQHVGCCCRPIYTQLHPTNKRSLKFLVMTLQGPNIEDLRKSKHPFSLTTTILVTRQMLLAIEYLHWLGYVHRDIKPSHFVIGLPPRHRHVMLIDFSISKSYVTKDRRPCIPRRRPGFRGTMEYASPKAHEGEELSRRDDLWSLLFTMVSLRKDLPWAKNNNHMTVKSLKLSEIDGLLKSVTPDFREFKRHVQSLDYYDQPDYNFLAFCFERAMRSLQLCENYVYDWEAPTGK